MYSRYMNNNKEGGGRGKQVGYRNIFRNNELVVYTLRFESIVVLYSHWSQIYSFGVCLCRICARSVPRPFPRLS